MKKNQLIVLLTLKAIKGLQNFTGQENKKKKLLLPFVLAGALLMLINSCKKDENSNSGCNASYIPTIINMWVDSITLTSAETGQVIELGDPITARGVCWSTSPNPTVELSTKTSDEISDNDGYRSKITGLTPSTTYYLRPYATNCQGTGYGASLTFRTLDIGDNYQGGIIAYILQSGDPGYNDNSVHGLIVAPSDQSAGAEWGCFGASISGADGTAIQTGMQNTLDIVNGCNTAGIAARICNDLVLGGYSDWYLPSKDELNILYLNRAAIEMVNPVFTRWWSSSEEFLNSGGIVTAWVHGWDQNQSIQEGHFKDNSTIAVRAIRNF